MRDKRRRKIGLLVGVMALVGAIIVPGTAAHSETVRAKVGVLRLHLDNGTGNKYFRFDTKTETGYSTGMTQSIIGSCPVTSLSGPQWVGLTAGTTSFTLNQVGLSNNGLGVRFLNCGRVDAPNWALRLMLGSEPPLNGPGIIGVDRAELDLQGWGGVTAVADLYLDGLKLPAPQQPAPQFISGNGTRARMVIDRTGLSLFDEIRLRPQASFDSVALRGGGAGSPPRSTMGDELNTDDSLFRVVSETTAPSLDVSKTALVRTDGGTTWNPVNPVNPPSAGDSIGFDIQVSNASGAGTASGVVVTDPLPTNAGLSWVIDASSSDTGCSIDIDSVTLTCTFGDIAGGSMKHVRITSPTTQETAATSPVVNLAAHVTATNGSSPDDATASVQVLGTGLSITKTADATDVVVPDPIGYTITVTNSGPGSAKDVTLNDDELPTATGLTWSIASQGFVGGPPGEACPEDLSGGTLTCDIGTMQGDSEYEVHITSPTSTDSVGTISNTATVEASNVAPDPASAEASITVFAGTLDCNEAADPQGGGSDPLNELVRLDNVGGGCGALIPYTLESGPNVTPGCRPDSPQCILLQKDLLGQNAQFFWTVTWAPETGDYMETETEFDFDLNGTFQPLQLCLADTDSDGFPNLPPTADSQDPPGAVDPWCVVNTSTELQIDTGLVIVTEKYFGSGDPGGKR